jgi:hypothetical protein
MLEVKTGTEVITATTPPWRDLLEKLGRNDHHTGSALRASAGRDDSQKPDQARLSGERRRYDNR